MSLFALFYMIFAYLLGSISSAILICKVAVYLTHERMVLIIQVQPMYCVLVDVGRRSQY